MAGSIDELSERDKMEYYPEAKERRQAELRELPFLKRQWHNGTAHIALAAFGVASLIGYGLHTYTIFRINPQYHTHFSDTVEMRDTNSDGLDDIVVKLNNGRDFVLLLMDEPAYHREDRYSLPPIE